MIKDGIYRSDSDYQKSLKKKPIESLHATIWDCKEAINAMPSNPNCGFYQDEIHYCLMEINNRNKKKA